jgi:hypothetical protein
VITVTAHSHAEETSAGSLVRQGSRKTYCDRLEIDGRKCRGFLGLFHSRVQGSCRVVYQPDAPLPCGAVVWIEISPDSSVIPLNQLHLGI